MAIVGSNVMLYINGTLAGMITDDTPIAWGSPGFMIAPISAVADAAISNWNGGSFKDAPLSVIAASWASRHRAFANKR